MTTTITTNTTTTIITTTTMTMNTATADITTVEVTFSSRFDNNMVRPENIASFTFHDES
jgi:hypothetical protein